MYPDFSYFMHDIFGTAPDNFFGIIKTFGFFLAVAILIGSYFLSQELKRKEQNGTLAPIKVMKDGKTTIVHPYEKTGDITLLCAFSGIVGAKLFALVESAETFQSFLRDPIHTLFSGSGLAIYGGLILAFLVVPWYVKKLGISTLQITDATAPALMIGYAVGRLGCQFSGDGDWGIQALSPKPGWASWIPDVLWSQTYPRNVLKEGIPIPDCIGEYCNQLAHGVYPTPVYESIMAFLIFLLLWSLRKKFVRAGQLFFTYCFLNGVERFFIEKIRVNEKLHLGGLTFTQAELISFILIFIGIIGFIITSRRKPETVIVTP